MIFHYQCPGRCRAAIGVQRLPCVLKDMPGVTAEVEAHPGEIEAGPALGAAPSAVVAPYAQAAAEAGLIPSFNNLRSPGIVWIPGAMAGMVLAGGAPIIAAIYQFVLVAMLFATAGTTAMLCTLLVR